MLPAQNVQASHRFFWLATPQLPATSQDTHQAVPCGRRRGIRLPARAPLIWHDARCVRCAPAPPPLIAQGYAWFFYAYEATVHALAGPNKTKADLSYGQVMLAGVMAGFGLWGRCAQRAGPPGTCSRSCQPNLPALWTALRQAGPKKASLYKVSAQDAPVG